MYAYRTHARCMHSTFIFICTQFNNVSVDKQEKFDRVYFLLNLGGISMYLYFNVCVCICP